MKIIAEGIDDTKSRIYALLLFEEFSMLELHLLIQFLDAFQLCRRLLVVNEDMDDQRAKHKADRIEGKKWVKRLEHKGNGHAESKETDSEVAVSRYVVASNGDHERRPADSDEQHQLHDERKVASDVRLIRTRLVKPEEDVVEVVDGEEDDFRQSERHCKRVDRLAKQIVDLEEGDDVTTAIYNGKCHKNIVQDGVHIHHLHIPVLDQQSPQRIRHEIHEDADQEVLVVLHLLLLIIFTDKVSMADDQMDEDGY